MSGRVTLLVLSWRFPRLLSEKLNRKAFTATWTRVCLSTQQGREGETETDLLYLFIALVLTLVNVSKIPCFGRMVAEPDDVVRQVWNAVGWNTRVLRLSRGR